jgi:hypothetical protein
MTGKIQTLIVTTLIGFLLSSCQSPETPQQVAQHFWQAVIEDKPDKVVIRIHRVGLQSNPPTQR